MRGLRGARGPLKPGMDFRVRLILFFVLLIPVLGAAISFLRLLFDDQTVEQGFMPNWLLWTPLLWGVIFGDLIGRRISATVGYHLSDMAGRLLELLFVLVCFALCALAGALLVPPRGVFLPAFGAGLFCLTGIVGFVRGLIAR